MVHFTLFIFWAVFPLCLAVLIKIKDTMATISQGIVLLLVSPVICPDEGGGVLFCSAKSYPMSFGPVSARWNTRSTLLLLFGEGMEKWGEQAHGPISSLSPSNSTNGFVL